MELVVGFAVGRGRGWVLHDCCGGGGGERVGLLCWRLLIVDGFGVEVICCAGSRDVEGVGWLEIG